MNILLLLSKIRKSSKVAGIRKYINLLYYDPDYVTIKISDFDIVETDGCQWYVSNQLNMNQRVKGNPWFEGVRNTDIVVDIGANIGAITIPLAKIAQKVYAVEPLYHKELEANIKLNKLDNVEVLKCGIGKGNNAKLEFGNKKGQVPLMSFNALQNKIGKQIDFLKIDGEGCEWDIEPSELEGIRELRIEFHIPRGKVKEYKKKYKQYIDWIKAKGYVIHISHVDIVANPYFAECSEVRASLK